MESEGASWSTPTPMTAHAAMTVGTTPVGFLETIRVINGDLECAEPSGSVGRSERDARIAYYNNFVATLGVSAGAMTTSYCP